MFHLRFETPLGPVQALADLDTLTGLYFEDQRNAPPPPSSHDDPQYPVLQRTRAQVLEYFADGRQDFDLPLSPNGTRFQLLVWTALRHIRAGQTLSYSELAHRLNRPTAIRAVTQAIARNPLILVIPCHRVIGAHGKLTGYSAGLERKRMLLAHERTTPKSNEAPLASLSDAQPVVESPAPAAPNQGGTT